jgi:hypothetical protein
VSGDQTHHLFFAVTGQNAVLTIRSDPQPVLDLLGTWERSLNALESQRQQQASSLITQTRGLVTTTDRQADTVAVARYRALQQTPDRTLTNREVDQQEAQLNPNEQQIAGNLRQLFPWFMDDPRAVASRFERANSIPAFEVPFTTATWMSVFGVIIRAAQYDLQWGRENAKVTVQGNAYELALAPDDLVPLAARVISAAGRLSATLGHGKPYFVVNDVRQFCIAAERLPNAPSHYPDPIVKRIVALLQQRAEITEDAATPGQYIFAEIPERRGIPPAFDSDRYRRHFYINGSAFATERAAIIRDEHPRIVDAVDDLLSGDAGRQARGQRIWNQLRQAEAVYRDVPFGDYDPNALKNSSNWAVDHQRALALHWQTGAGLGDAGNNTSQERRQEVAGGRSNLRIMWGPKNSAEQARGGRYVNYVERGFTSLVTRTKGPAYVDYDDKFVEYLLR